MTAEMNETPAIERKNGENFENFLHWNMTTIAGFSYWNGVFVFDKLKIGTTLTLLREPENRYDSHTIAIFSKIKKSDIFLE